MYKICLTVAAVFLTGCASTGEWRALNIDGSSEAAFGDSLARLDGELSYSRSQMFALALVDIANTRVESAGVTEAGLPDYSDQDFRSDLNGLNYDGVIALADQSGPSIKTLYRSRSWGSTQSEVNRQMSLSDQAIQRPTQPVFQDTNSGYVWPTAWPASR